MQPMVNRVNSRADRRQPDSPGKAEWRKRILRTRRALDSAVHESEAHALAAAARALAVADATVCAYVPVRSEPGSIAMLDELVSGGSRVLLPVAREAGPLRWAQYEGTDSLVPAPFGLLEPAGHVLAEEEIASATIVLVPALAVDRRGVRLGRGAGFYDRTLGMAGPRARLLAVVRDDEVVDHLPADPHDRPIHAALTPNHGIIELGAL